MTASKSLIAATAALAIVSSIGLAYGQAGSPSSDTSSSGDKSLQANQPAGSGTMTPRTTTPTDRAATGTTSDTTRSENKTLPLNAPSTSSGQTRPMGGTTGTQSSTDTMSNSAPAPTPMQAPMDSTGRPSSGSTLNDSSNSGMSGMSNNNGRTSSGARAARADRN